MKQINDILKWGLVYNYSDIENCYYKQSDTAGRQLSGPVFISGPPDD